VSYTHKKAAVRTTRGLDTTSTSCTTAGEKQLTPVGDAVARWNTETTVTAYYGETV